MKVSLNNLILTVVFLFSLKSLAHPTGNLISFGDYVLWSYINPVNGRDHRACIMIWKPGSSPQVMLTSEYPASDYMLSKNESHIFIIERRFVEKSDEFEFRILKTRPGDQAEEIWAWQKDDWRIGEGGFFMPADDEVIFSRYPGVYKLSKTKTPLPYFNFPYPVKRIRHLDNHRLLLLGDDSCWLTNHKGKILKEWNGLTEKPVKDPPLGRNQVFDIDLKNDELLLAYWGKGSFESFKDGKRNTLLQMEKAFVPHWVAFYGTNKLLFASQMFLDGKNPQPKLILYNSKDKREIIWK